MNFNIEKKIEYFEKIHIFEGIEHEKAIKMFLNKERFYGPLNLNKVILKCFVRILESNQWDLNSTVDSIKNSTRKELKNKYIIKNYLNFIKAIIKIFFYKNKLIIESRGKSKIWILKPPGDVRPNYLKEFISYKKLESPPYLVSWSRKRINLFDGIKHFLLFIELIVICSSKICHIRDAFQFALVALSAVDLIDDTTWSMSPEAVLSLKDFDSIENAIIQIANLKKIKTFTSQHGVYHFFGGKNYRGGQILFLSQVAENILCWGSYTQNVFREQCPEANTIVIEANLRPKILSKVLNHKESYLFALGGRMHIQESLKLISFAKNLDEDNNNIQIFIRPHPTLILESYNKFVKDLNFENEVFFQNIKDLKNEFVYPENMIVITGTTGAYYDFLYLGYKVVFYDHGYDFLYKMPVVTSISNYNDLVSVIENDLKDPSWDNKADKVLKECLNLGAKKEPKFTLPEIIYDLISSN